MHITLSSTILFLSLFFLTFPLQAQEKAPVSLDATLDLVNQNIWRGTYVAGASLQPETVMRICNWQFSVWGSTDFRAEDKEIDLTVKYCWQDLGIGFTDYWFERQNAPYSKNHLLEANLEYQFRKMPVSVSYNMRVTGENNWFSPYMEANYTPEWKAWSIELALGFTPWENTMLATTGFAATRLSAGIRKSLPVGNSVSIEAFTNLTYNPDADALFWIAGLSIPF
jgi:hypothetical protein